MNSVEAVRGLSALGHESRLMIFRALVQAGPEGLAAGEISRRLDLAPSALTFHLKELNSAGLTESRQSGRFVIYSAVFPAITGLVGYLTENCCGGADCGLPLPSRRGFRAKKEGASSSMRHPARPIGTKPRSSTARSQK